MSESIEILDSLPQSTVFETDLSKHHLSLLVGNTPSPIGDGYPQEGYPIYYCGKTEEPVILPKYPRGNSVDTVAKTDFLSKKEQKNYFSITVDTNYSATVAMATSLVWPKIDSIYYVKAYLIIAINRSADKAILMDRAHIFRAVLEAKNTKGKWRQIHRVFSIGCGLEANLIKGSKMSVNILPPNGVLIAKMILPNGNFETECRLRYQLYNFTHVYDDSVKRFWFDTDVEPVFSNTFKLKIFKDQFVESDYYEEFFRR